MMTPVRVLLVAVLAVSAARAGCPSKCRCMKQAVNCTGGGLESVPSFEGLELQPSAIDLSFNEIMTIGSMDFNFDAAADIKVLNLTDNSIFDVSERAFLEMTGLQEIYLAKNLLEVVPDLFVEDNSNLVLLDLSGNFFEEDTPKIHSQTLEALDLSLSKISTFTEENVMYIPNLKILNLSNNNLQIVDPAVFDALPNLISVNVYYNIWECSEKTIHLFDYLLSRNLTEISDPVRCLNEQKLFLEIYTKEGGGVDINQIALEELMKEELEENDEDYLYNDDEESTADQPVADKELQEIAEEIANSSSIEPSMDVVINEDVNIFVLGQPDTFFERKYQYFFTDSLVVLVAAMAFVLTFLSGLFIGFCVVGRSNMRLRSRRNMNSSTSTLISKLTEDIA